MSTVSSTFIIRLWTAPAPISEESRRGRGRIDHVQSGEYLYFDQLAEALDFVRQHFGAYDSISLQETVEPSSSLDRI